MSSRHLLARGARSGKAQSYPRFQIARPEAQEHVTFNPLVNECGEDDSSVPD